MRYQDLTAVRYNKQFEATTPDIIGIIEKLADEALYLTKIDMQGDEYIFCMFKDRSVFAFHMSELEKKVKFRSVLFFAYQEQNQIPQCVKENAATIGTVRFENIHKIPETIQ